jgi:protein SCO1
VTALLLAAALAASPAPARARVAASIPDVPLVDQDGRPVRLVTDLLRDHTVVVSFVFTTCTTICSPMTAILSRAQDEVGGALGKEILFVTITLDPVTDTPERLRAYADRFHRRAGWSFLTGPPERVKAALQALGGWVPDRSAHPPIAIVGKAAAGAWFQIDGFSRPRKIAEEARRVSRLPPIAARGAEKAAAGSAP